MPGAGGAWQRQVDAEEALLKSPARQTNKFIVETLLRFEAVRLRQLGRAAGAAGPVARLVQLESGNAESLAKLAEWLIDEKQWQAIDALAAKYPAQFENCAALAYLLAEAQAERGQSEKAVATAQRAFKLDTAPEARTDATAFFQRQLAIVSLQLRGRFAG